MNRFKNRWEQMFVYSDDENGIPGADPTPGEGEDPPASPAPTFTADDVRGIVTQAVSEALAMAKPQTPAVPVIPQTPGAPEPTMEELRRAYATTDNFEAQAGVVEQMIHRAVKQTRDEVTREFQSTLSGAEFNRQSTARSIVNERLREAEEEVRAEATTILSQYDAATMKRMTDAEFEMVQALAEKRAVGRQSQSPKPPATGKGAPLPPASEKPQNPEIAKAAAHFKVDYATAEKWAQGE